MMKTLGAVLIAGGVVQLVGNALQGRIRDVVLVVATVMIVGGLIVLSLQQVRDVLLEDQRERREALEVEATLD